jgi:hypothetical protein
MTGEEDGLADADARDQRAEHDAARDLKEPA